MCGCKAAKSPNFFFWVGGDQNSPKLRMCFFFNKLFKRKVLAYLFNFLIFVVKKAIEVTKLVVFLWKWGQSQNLWKHSFQPTGMIFFALKKKNHSRV